MRLTMGRNVAARLSEFEVMRAGLGAKCRKEDEPTTNVTSCFCTGGKRVIEIGVSSKAVFGPTATPDGLLTYTFDTCRTCCSSSRDHRQFLPSFSTHTRTADSLSFGWGLRRQVAADDRDRRLARHQTSVFGALCRASAGKAETAQWKLQQREQQCVQQRGKLCSKQPLAPAASAATAAATTRASARKAASSRACVHCWAAAGGGSRSVRGSNAWDARDGADS